MKKFQDTYDEYRTVERDPIQYTYCVDFPHISRYKGLRQVIHQGQSSDRFIALETVNPIPKDPDVTYYTVPYHMENRLDLIAQEQLGSATYAWVLAYYNRIPDGFTVLEGARLAIPSSISNLFNKGQLLQSVTAVKLNLGSE